MFTFCTFFTILTFLNLFAPAASAPLAFPAASPSDAFQSLGLLSSLGTGTGSSSSSSSSPLSLDALGSSSSSGTDSNSDSESPLDLLDLVSSAAGSTPGSGSNSGLESGLTSVSSVDPTHTNANTNGGQNKLPLGLSPASSATTLLGRKVSFVPSSLGEVDERHEENSGDNDESVYDDDDAYEVGTAFYKRAERFQIRMARARALALAGKA